MNKLPKGIILAAHKPIASAMLKAATMIMGPIEHCAAADIDSNANEKEQFEHLTKVWDSVQAEEIIILKKYTSGKRCMIVSPLSFPLFFKVLTYRSLSFEELRAKAQEVRPVICIPGECTHENR